MRRLFALAAAMGMFAGLGCHHCNECSSGCCDTGYHAAPAGPGAPAPKPEDIKRMPSPTGGAPKVGSIIEE